MRNAEETFHYDTLVQEIMQHYRCVFDMCSKNPSNKELQEIKTDLNRIIVDGMLHAGQIPQIVWRSYMAEMHP